MHKFKDEALAKSKGVSKSKMGTAQELKDEISAPVMGTQGEANLLS